MYNWLLDIFKDQSDDLVLIGFVLCALLLTALAHGEGRTDESRPVTRMYGLLPIVCVLLYFTTGEGHGYIWLISPALPHSLLPHGDPAAADAAWPRHRACSAPPRWPPSRCTARSTSCKHFITFQREEVGDIDGAIDEMDPGKKVAALIFDKGSKTTNWTPFLHFGSYYQLHKGGVIQFTYAGYAHWPFDFKPGKFPPPGGPARLRWEWTPEQVGIRELFPYYDYVLVRGNGFHPPPGTFHEKWHGDRWDRVRAGHAGVALTVMRSRRHAVTRNPARGSARRAAPRDRGRARRGVAWCADRDRPGGPASPRRGRWRR